MYRIQIEGNLTAPGFFTLRRRHGDVASVFQTIPPPPPATGGRSAATLTR